MAKSEQNKRMEALETARAQVERQFGSGALIRLGDQPQDDIEVISTGSLSLDIALGVGGLPRGRIVEIYGAEASGKTTLALHAIGEAQRGGGVAAMIDAEHAMDTSYARRLGLDVDELLLSQPENGEQALEIADVLARSGAVDMIVIDSVAALVPKAEIEGEMGDQFVGLQARMMSQAMRKLTGTLKRSSTIAVFINQIREKIGVMFGSPETTPGGRALKFYASVRIKTRRISSIKSGTDIIGSEHQAQVLKNKVAPPYRNANFEILYGTGISREGEVLTMGIDAGLIKKSGSWLTWGEQRMQGREAARQYLLDNPLAAWELENQVRAEHGVNPRPKPSAEELAAPPADADGAGNGALFEDDAKASAAKKPAGRASSKAAATDADADEVEAVDEVEVG